MYFSWSSHLTHITKQVKIETIWQEQSLLIGIGCNVWLVAKAIVYNFSHKGKPQKWSKMIKELENCFIEQAFGSLYVTILHKNFRDNPKFKMFTNISQIENLCSYTSLSSLLNNNLGQLKKLWLQTLVSVSQKFK